MRLPRAALRSASAAAAFALARRHVGSEPCDVLLLHDFPGGIERADTLAKALEADGLDVRHSVIPSPGRMLLSRLIARARPVGPFDFRLLEDHAAYIAARYRPRLLLTFMDASPLSIFLRRAIARHGGRVVNIAHGLTADTPLFVMFDFDYYFVFGRSSVEAAQRQKTRCGSTRLVEAGSFLIDPGFSLPPNPASRTVVFLSSWLAPTVGEVLKRNARLVADWCRSQSTFRLHVKLHPLEDEAAARAVFSRAPGVTILPKATTLKAALAGASLVMTGWSVGALEAAVLNRPCVIVNDSDLPDYFEYERAYGARARSVEQIQARLDEATRCFDALLCGSRALVGRHLAHTTGSIPFMVRCLRSIAAGREDFPCTPVDSTADYFQWRKTLR